nr:THAP domain-containing protein 5-like isoform X3 [Halyomorpha halys]
MKRFPSNSERRNIWIEKVKKNRENWTPTNASRLCEAHFAPEMLERNRADGKHMLRWNAIPTIFRRKPEKKTKESPTKRSSEKENSESPEEQSVPAVDAEPELNADGLQDDYGKELLAGCSRLKEISFDVRTKVKRELRADENEEMYNGPSIKKTKLQEIRDDSQIFGDFVAAELRNLKSETNRKKLKRIILRGVLEVSESED